MDPVSCITFLYAFCFVTPWLVLFAPGPGSV